MPYQKSKILNRASQEYRFHPFPFEISVCLFEEHPDPLFTCRVIVEKNQAPYGLVCAWGRRYRVIGEYSGETKKEKGQEQTVEEPGITLKSDIWNRHEGYMQRTATNTVEFGKGNIYIVLISCLKILPFSEDG